MTENIFRDFVNGLDTEPRYPDWTYPDGKPPQPEPRRQPVRQLTQRQLAELEAQYRLPRTRTNNEPKPVDKGPVGWLALLVVYILILAMTGVAMT